MSPESKEKSAFTTPLDYVCETTLPTVDPEQTITWKDGTTEWRELQEGTQKSVRGIGAFLERASCNRSHFLARYYVVAM